MYQSSLEKGSVIVSDGTTLYIFEVDGGVINLVGSATDWHGKQTFFDARDTGMPPRDVIEEAERLSNSILNRYDIAE